MKLIQAIIQPSKAEAVRDALTAAGVPGLTAVEVKGYGRQNGLTASYRGAEYDVQFVPKVVFQIVAEDTQVEAISDVIANAAKSGNIGDGKILIYPADDAIRIRTGESGTSALSSPE